ncbi:GNAT family N-acetyltransferase [Actinopolymorpha pittospori]|uniref:N-acetyltransferase domain-containing protein n=1 Tax=Actinopolymorpha pittospori TaxID=648752 RepID=A0A927MWS2_9ACTN|nr:GNAT family N-acetyltransferase [Actinopolymorpha pittospori]MBE1606193.1 hypothetical protein [Actinopolymorpha pittospori]
MTVTTYRVAYDAQVRGRFPTTVHEGMMVERSGPVVRHHGNGRPGLVDYRDLGGLEGPGLDAFIAAQRDFYTGLGQAAEWKYHDYDLPEDLPKRLVAAGFVAQEPKTVLVGDAVRLATEVTPPAGVRIRTVTDRADLHRIAEMETAVWGADYGWLVEALSADIAVDQTVVLVAETGLVDPPTMVSVAWLRVTEGTEFAGLWGGSTLVGWRGRGIYRALVARRAHLALERGIRYLRVDASPDSAPILRRLGLLAVATTTPYVWSPPARRP